MSAATCTLYITLWVSTILNVCLLGYVVILDHRRPDWYKQGPREGMEADSMEDRLRPDQIYSTPPYRKHKKAKK